MVEYLIPKLEILPDAQRRLWDSLYPSIKHGMVLYGGTAIALQLGHRHSIDFDFFQHTPLNKDLIHKDFDFVNESTVIQEEENALSLIVPSQNGETVKVSFFGGITFGRVGNPRFTTDGIMKVASLEDLMATKLKVIVQRVEVKDYIDVASLIQSGVSLEKGLASARLMFGNNFQPSICLKTLTWFNDGDLKDLNQESKDVLIDAVTNIQLLPEVKLLDPNLSTMNESVAAVTPIKAKSQDLTR